MASTSKARTDLYQEIADALHITKAAAKRKVLMFGYGHFDALPPPGPAILATYTEKLKGKLGYATRNSSEDDEHNP